MAYQTDKEIIDEADKLFKDCLAWATANYPEQADEIQLKIGITRFLYLKDKLLDHSPKYYRDKDLANKGKGGTPIIKNA